jgi:hypothetical protein
MMVYEPQFQNIVQQVKQFSQEQTKEMMRILAQQLRKVEPEDAEDEIKSSWLNLAGIAPNLLEGQDAQEWVNEVRKEWERDFH